MAVIYNGVWKASELEMLRGWQHISSNSCFKKKNLDNNEWS